jgi:hypothetical protein
LFITVGFVALLLFGLFLLIVYILGAAFLALTAGGGAGTYQDGAPLPLLNLVIRLGPTPLPIEGTGCPTNECDGGADRELVFLAFTFNISLMYGPPD